MREWPKFPITDKGKPEGNLSSSVFCKQRPYTRSVYSFSIKNRIVFDKNDPNLNQITVSREFKRMFLYIFTFLPTILDDVQKKFAQMVVINQLEREVNY
jgi:hypothetical protein